MEHPKRRKFCFLLVFDKFLRFLNLLFPVLYCTKSCFNRSKFYTRDFDLKCPVEILPFPDFQFSFHKITV